MQIRAAAGEGPSRGLSRPLSAPALRRPAPARRARPRHRPAAERVPDGRAALQPRRQAPELHARRAEAPPGRPRHHHDLRHPRPDRGDDARPPRRGDEQGRRPADRDAPRDLRQPRQSLRRRVHRLAADEHARRRHRRRRLRHRRGQGSGRSFRARDRPWCSASGRRTRGSSTPPEPTSAPPSMPASSPATRPSSRCRSARRRRW